MGVIHSYTFHPFRRFWGKGFWKSIVFVGFCFTKKNAAPWAAIVEIKQFTYVYNLGFKIWQARHNGPQWFISKGMHVPQTTLFFGHAKQPEKCPQVTLLLVLSNHGLLLLQPQRLIEPLLYTSGSVITVLKGCLAASSNFSLVRFMEPHTSQFEIFLEKNESYVFDNVSKISSKHNASWSNQNLENLLGS